MKPVKSDSDAIAEKQVIYLPLVHPQQPPDKVGRRDAALALGPLQHSIGSRETGAVASPALQAVTDRVRKIDQALHDMDA